MRTSTAGTEDRTGQPRRPPAPGFSLVELLIVITLLVTLAAVLAPALSPSPARSVRAAAGEIATGLRETRRQALAGRTRQRFLLDTARGDFGHPGSGPRRTLPDGVRTELTTAKSLLTGDDSGAIDFFPDGSSTGGRVVVAAAGHALRVDIDWLTGRVRVREFAP